MIFNISLVGSEMCIRDRFKSLYDQATQLPNVTYVGYKPNEFIKENLKNYHMFAYPNIWEETSCVTAIEAMAAGLYCITTDFGAPVSYYTSPSPRDRQKSRMPSSA